MKKITRYSIYKSSISLFLLYHTSTIKAAKIGYKPLKQNNLEIFKIVIEIIADTYLDILHKLS